MKKHNLKNQTFGRLTAIQEAGAKGIHPLWLCKCECGNFKTILQTHLIQGNTKSCGCLSRVSGSEHKDWSGFGEISGNFWSSIKRKRRHSKDREFSISIQQAWELFLKQDRKCALSGQILYFEDHQRSKRTASLDRIDSSKGYVIDNVQWVHKDINRMKNIYSNEYFIQTCKLIADQN